MGKEPKYLKYIDYLDYEEFISTMLNQKFGKDMKIMAGRRRFGDGKAVIEFIAGLEDASKVERIVRGTAVFEDYQCKISVKNYRSLYTKPWGEFVCKKIVANMGETQQGDFMVEEYKNDYNAYWQGVRQQEVNRANNSYNANKI